MSLAAALCENPALDRATFKKVDENFWLFHPQSPPAPPTCANLLGFCVHLCSLARYSGSHGERRSRIFAKIGDKKIPQIYRIIRGAYFFTIPQSAPLTAPFAQGSLFKESACGFRYQKKLAFSFCGSFLAPVAAQSRRAYPFAAHSRKCAEVCKGGREALLC